MAATTGGATGSDAGGGAVNTETAGGAVEVQQEEAKRGDETDAVPQPTARPTAIFRDGKLVVIQEEVEMRDEGERQTDAGGGVRGIMEEFQPAHEGGVNDEEAGHTTQTGEDQPAQQEGEEGEPAPMGTEGGGVTEAEGDADPGAWALFSRSWSRPVDYAEAFGNNYIKALSQVAGRNVGPKDLIRTVAGKILTLDDLSELEGSALTECFPVCLEILAGSVTQVRQEPQTRDESMADTNENVRVEEVTQLQEERVTQELTGVTPPTVAEVSNREEKPALTTEEWLNAGDEPRPVEDADMRSEGSYATHASGRSTEELDRLRTEIRQELGMEMETRLARMEAMLLGRLLGAGVAGQGRDNTGMEVIARPAHLPPLQEEEDRKEGLEFQSLSSSSNSGRSRDTARTTSSHSEGESRQKGLEAMGTGQMRESGKHQRQAIAWWNKAEEGEDGGIGRNEDVEQWETHAVFRVKITNVAINTRLREQRTKFKDVLGGKAMSGFIFREFTEELTRRITEAGRGSGEGTGVPRTDWFLDVTKAFRAIVSEQKGGSSGEVREKAGNCWVGFEPRTEEGEGCQEFLLTFRIRPGRGEEAGVGEVDFERGRNAARVLMEDRDALRNFGVDMVRIWKDLRKKRRRNKDAQLEREGDDDTDADDEEDDDDDDADEGEDRIRRGGRHGGEGNGNDDGKETDPDRGGQDPTDQDNGTGGDGDGKDCRGKDARNGMEGTGAEEGKGAAQVLAFEKEGGWGEAKVGAREKTISTNDRKRRCREQQGTEAKEGKHEGNEVVTKRGRYSEAEQRSWEKWSAPLTSWWTWTGGFWQLTSYSGMMAMGSARQRVRRKMPSSNGSSTSDSSDSETDSSSSSGKGAASCRRGRGSLRRKGVIGKAAGVGMLAVTCMGQSEGTIVEQHWEWSDRLCWNIQVRMQDRDSYWEGMTTYCPEGEEVWHWDKKVWFLLGGFNLEGKGMWFSVMRFWINSVGTLWGKACRTESTLTAAVRMARRDGRQSGWRERKARGRGG